MSRGRAELQLHIYQARNTALLLGKETEELKAQLQTDLGKVMHDDFVMTAQEHIEHDIREDSSTAHSIEVEPRAFRSAEDSLALLHERAGLEMSQEQARIKRLQQRIQNQKAALLVAQAKSACLMDPRMCLSAEKIKEEAALVASRRVAVEKAKSSAEEAVRVLETTVSRLRCSVESALDDLQEAAASTFQLNGLVEAARQLDQAYSALTSVAT
eukprot:TRINITY_DN56857_c0_g1_i1.p1 TRINITY_DN56857_c0_g1~~TRINITY_DN56857_c0_g1_i1.p1  ORF type:complete len:214 (-),score=49.05 TRINITY_DN56857_c0_g1_i1:155-796(-)